jgi:hypothetical protein
MKPGDQYRWVIVILAYLVICPVSLEAAVSDAGQDGAADFPTLQAAVDIGAYGSHNRVPIYRFWSPVLGRHFYTIDEAERDHVIENYTHVWTFEGVAYYTYAQNSEPGLMTVYRFWSPVSGGHFYTIDEAERDHVIEHYTDTWTFEGPAFFAYPENGRPQDATAVYRFWSGTLGQHFYTIDEAERDYVVENYAQVWAFEGVAWYAYTTPNGGGPIPSGAGVFEFSGGPDEASYVLTLKAYVNGVEAKIDNSRLTYVPDIGYMRMAVDFGARTAAIQEIMIESQLAQHAATIRGGPQDSIVIPITLSSSVLFWATTLRGPYAINPQTSAFPTSQSVLPGGNETFTINGSVNVDNRKVIIGTVARATRFSEGQGIFYGEGLPQTLDVQMAAPFLWSRSQREDYLLQTTVGGNELRLYISSAQLRTTGVWEGRRAN